MELIKNISIFTIGSISIAGAIVFIAKYLISKIFDGFFETYKLSLAKEIENYKMDLQKQTYEHNVTFNKLHLERAEIIKTLYVKLVDMQDAICVLIREKLTSEEPNEIPEEIDSFIREFLVFTNHNRIYFDSEICSNIEEIEAIIMIICKAVESGAEKKEAESFREFLKTLVESEIPKFKEILENKFRIILGVDN